MWFTSILSQPKLGAHLHALSTGESAEELLLLSDNLISTAPVISMVKVTDIWAVPRAFPGNSISFVFDHNSSPLSPIALAGK